MPSVMNLKVVPPCIASGSPGVVGEHEHGAVVGRVLAPSAPPAGIPVAADRSEHVAAHHERAGGHDPVDLGLVLVGGVEHPGVQPVHWSVAERLVRCLARTGPARWPSAETEMSL
jgi:hypothetical protein